MYSVNISKLDSNPQQCTKVNELLSEIVIITCREIEYSEIIPTGILLKFVMMVCQASKVAEFFSTVTLILLTVSIVVLLAMRNGSIMDMTLTTVLSSGFNLDFLESFNSLSMSDRPFSSVDKLANC